MRRLNGSPWPERVHDVVSQSMSAVALQAAAAAVPAGGGEHDQAHQRFVAINATARDALHEMNRIVAAMRTPAATADVL